MSGLKVHYEHGPHGNACGRAAYKSTTNVYAVTCLACKNSDQFQAAKVAADDVALVAFLAQPPRTFREPWIGPWKREENIVCASCGSDLFRYRGRSCQGHYDDYVCASCGHVESRLTETGMSF